MAEIDNAAPQETPVDFLHTPVTITQDISMQAYKINADAGISGEKKGTKQCTEEIKDIIIIVTEECTDHIPTLSTATVAM